ncbi:hypothetical protein CMI37_26920 [Candidatus Pacearchaeota archaeon]|nr:hypothetical protein [Candidatus Pacearchaeota archaeon]|tara:strand:- start:2438 stop:3379 length:942 start_codon:yes stop_codon:yes gene_type:complete
MRISVVIPSAPEDELRVVESLKRQKEKIGQVVVVRGRNTSKNRNRGGRAAREDFVAFTNSHSSFPEDWSENVIKFFELHPEIDIVGGPQLTPEGNSFFGRTSGYALSSIFGAANVSKRYGLGKLNLSASETDVTSSNLICRRVVCENVNWDEEIYPGEDPKFIADAKKAGFKVAYSPDIVGYNKRRDNFAGLFKQIFKYGVMRPRKESFSQTIKMPLFLVPFLFVLYLVFLLINIVGNLFLTGNVIGSWGGSGFGWVLFFPLIAYLLLNILFSIYESAKNKDLISVLVLPLIFATIHISYGAGMLGGYLRKFK